MLFVRRRHRVPGEKSAPASMRTMALSMSCVFGKIGESFRYLIVHFSFPAIA